MSEFTRARCIVPSRETSEASQTVLIGLLSDSHDHLHRLERGLKRLDQEGAEVLLHPGDIIAPFAAKLLVAIWTRPFHVTYGNNDGERRGLLAVLPTISDGPLLLDLGGRRISLFHYPPDADHPAPDADILVFGHTHQVLVEPQPIRPEGPGGKTRLWINPGECCGWVTGRATVGLLDTESLRVDIIDID